MSSRRQLASAGHEALARRDGIMLLGRAEIKAEEAHGIPPRSRVVVRGRVGTSRSGAEQEGGERVSMKREARYPHHGQQTFAPDGWNKPARGPSSRGKMRGNHAPEVAARTFVDEVDVKVD